MNGEQSLQHTRALIRQALLDAGARVRPLTDVAHPTLEKTELRTQAPHLAVGSVCGGWCVGVARTMALVAAARSDPGAGRKMGVGRDSPPI